MFGKIQNWSVLTFLSLWLQRQQLLSNRTGREETLTYFNENCLLTFFPPTNQDGNTPQLSVQQARQL